MPSDRKCYCVSLLHPHLYTFHLFIDDGFNSKLPGLSEGFIWSLNALKADQGQYTCSVPALRGCQGWHLDTQQVRKNSLLHHCPYSCSVLALRGCQGWHLDIEQARQNGVLLDTEQGRQNGVLQ